jgi:uncharacterized protein with von Willebrand factor type A (vWA) domain
MSPLLEKVLQEIEQLTSEELLDTIAYATEQLKRRTVDNKDNNQVKPKWLEIAGTAPYPLMGEDAQEWVTRTRQEAQEHRVSLLLWQTIN